MRGLFLIVSLLVVVSSACSTSNPLALEDNESARRAVPAEQCSPDVFPC